MFPLAELEDPLISGLSRGNPHQTEGELQLQYTSSFILTNKLLYYYEISGGKLENKFMVRVDVYEG
jgi:hypothetical protein